MLLGPIGLNTIPSARMDKVGTVRLGTSTLDPYVHAYLGFQLADGVYIQLRQTAEVSGLNDPADRLYPGIDVKLRLAEETQTRPEISLGLQSALGHRRMAGEYIALSKRYLDFDITGGIGWGRYGRGVTILNPLRTISHFKNRRISDSEMPGGPEDWFTGKAALFGGIEYFTPLKGLSLKADWNGDDYRAEQAAFGFKEPARWLAGLSYAPADWLNIGIAALGTDKVMGRLTLSAPLTKWRKYKKDSVVFIRPHRTDSVSPALMERKAAGAGMTLVNVTNTPNAVSADLLLSPHDTFPAELGEAAIYMANNAGQEIEKMSVTPTLLGLRGPRVSMLRKDFEKALARHEGSAEEIWRHAEFQDQHYGTERNMRLAEATYGLNNPRFMLEQQLSLSEEDHGILTRTSLIAGTRRARLFGLLDSGYSLRLNLFDNLDNLNTARVWTPLPVRSNVDRFARNRIAIDEMYVAFTHSIRSDLHVSAIGGYLEEMYGGIGGEILYRPFESRWALGAEMWEALKREPSIPLAAGFNGDHLLSGHLNAWYDAPGMDLVVGAKLGRYLAEDWGGTLSIQKKFENGATLQGFVTVTDNADPDPFGGTTHAVNGVRLTLPLGGFKHMPRNSSIQLRAEPFGRNSGQSIQNPLPLYDLTEPFSQAHIVRNWGDVAR